MKSPINIHPSSVTPFAAALSWSEDYARKCATIEQEYTLDLNGVSYPSLYSAFIVLASGKNEVEQFEILVELLAVKLSAYPMLNQTITISGGIRWLYTCCCFPVNGKKDLSSWYGCGLNSFYLTALVAAYRQVNAESILEIAVAEESDLPIEQINTKERGDRLSFNKLLSYDPVIRQMSVLFNDRFKAKEWIAKLKKLEIGKAFSLETAVNKDWKYELVVSLVPEETVERLTINARFDLRPGVNNPTPEMSATLVEK